MNVVLKARSEIESAKESVELFKRSRFISDKIRHASQYIRSYKAFYSKMQQLSKTSNECMNWWETEIVDFNDRESSLYYLRMARNAIEHGDGAPIKYNMSAKISNSPKKLFSKSDLAFDVEMDLHDPDVQYSLEFVSFEDRRAHRTVEVPKHTAGMPLSSHSVELICSSTLNAAIAHFNQAWRLAR